MQLIVAKPAKSNPYIQHIVKSLQQKTDPQNQAIIELVATVMAYKFPRLSHEEIEAMFSVSELKQTRLYQDLRAEGRAEGQTQEAQTLIQRQLCRRFGAIAPHLETQIKSLSLTHLEDLGEALLDFETVADLEAWLKQHP